MTICDKYRYIELNLFHDLARTELRMFAPKSIEADPKSIEANPLVAFVADD